MRITFILPFAGHRPVGGFKVVYEYANGLATRGHEVAVVHAPYLVPGETSILRRVRQLGVYLVRKAGVGGGYTPQKWFRIDPRVRLLWLPSLHCRWVPAGDVVVATAWETAEAVGAYPASKGRKFYLIQHQESMFAGVDVTRVMKTWTAPLAKIVIAQWLADIAAELGEQSTYIPNGLDFATFGLDVPITVRTPHRLIMLYHHHDWKGSHDGLQAMEQVRAAVPELEATLFGILPRPASLPPWVNYVQKPTQALLRQLYNEAAIFVGPSWAEGWPLPPAEAAQCGAALCLTDIGGHREYASHNETALLSAAREPRALADNILSLVQDHELRHRLAEAGYQYMARFTWERAVTSMERTLSGVMGDGGYSRAAPH